MFGNHDGFYLKPLGIGNHEWCFETYMIWSMCLFTLITAELIRDRNCTRFEIKADTFPYLYPIVFASIQPRAPRTKWSDHLWYLKDERRQAARSFLISPTSQVGQLHQNLYQYHDELHSIKSYYCIERNDFCRTEIWYTIRNTVANLCTLTFHICNTICNQHFWWGSDVWSQRFPGTSSQKAEKKLQACQTKWSSTP